MALPLEFVGIADLEHVLANHIKKKKIGILVNTKQ